MSTGGQCECAMSELQRPTGHLPAVHWEDLAEAQSPASGIRNRAPSIQAAQRASVPRTRRSSSHRPQVGGFKRLAEDSLTDVLRDRVARTRGHGLPLQAPIQSIAQAFEFFARSGDISATTRVFLALASLSSNLFALGSLFSGAAGLEYASVRANEAPG